VTDSSPAPSTKHFDLARGVWEDVWRLCSSDDLIILERQNNDSGGGYSNGGGGYLNNNNSTSNSGDGRNGNRIGFFVIVLK
jgi:hypothetical protein